MPNPEAAVQGKKKSVSPVALTGPKPGRGLSFRRHYTKPGIHPFDTIEWESRTSVIQNEKGEIIFEQKDVEAPKSWSMTATNVVVSKYFHGKLGTPNREKSVRQLVDRVSRTMVEWGKKGGYFSPDEDAETFL